MMSNSPVNSSGQLNTEVRILLDWMNVVLEPRQPCVSMTQLRSGVIWCRLLVKLDPRLLESDRVYWQPRGAEERHVNYELLKKAFKAASVEWNYSQQAMIDGHIGELIRLAKQFVFLYDMHHKSVSPDALKLTAEQIRSSQMTSHMLQLKRDKLMSVLNYQLPPDTATEQNLSVSGCCANTEAHP